MVLGCRQLGSGASTHASGAVELCAGNRPSAAPTRTAGPVPGVQREGDGTRVGLPCALTRSTRLCTSSSAEA